MLFEPLGPAEIQRLAKQVKMDSRQAFKQDADTAIDYYMGRQLDDVRNELNSRHEATQDGDFGQQIQPFVMNITERFVVESADAYRKSPTRQLVWPDGSTDGTTEAQTEAYVRHLETIGYDETMQANDEFVHLLQSTGVLHEAKRGRYRPAIKMPQDVYPVAPEDPDFMDAADADDYAGFIVEMYWAAEDVTKAQERTFMFISAGQIAFFVGTDPAHLTRQLSSFDNPYSWEQTFDIIDRSTGSRTTKTEVMPGQMLTMWSRRRPVLELIPQPDVDIVAANRELNVAASQLLDVIKMQGHNQPWIQSTNINATRARMRYGARFPLVLGPTEAAGMMSAATSFGEQMDVLKTLLKMVGMTKRLSPNDFSAEAGSAMSGFAKAVENIPKMEAREERIRRLRSQESQSWPRQRAIMQQLGILDSSTDQMRLTVDFAGVEPLKTIDERNKEQEHDFKFKLSTPAHVLAKRRGISIEDAKEAIKENAEILKEISGSQKPEGEQGPPQPPQQGGLGGGLLGGLIGRTKPRQPPPPPQKGEEEGEEEDAKAPRR